MLSFLKRFYHDCMLPEILDSRHNRHMLIRDPQYVKDAKEKASERKIIRKTAQQNYVDKQENKRLKLNLMQIDLANIATVSDTEQDSDCILVSYSKIKQNLTKDEIAKRKKVLDDIIAPLPLVRENVLPIQSKLNDESLDRFLRVVRETSCFETQSVLYLEFPDLITGSDSDNSLQIIGGNCTDHW